MTMAPSQTWRFSVVYTIVVCYGFTIACHALVVTGPTVDGHGSPTTSRRSNNVVTKIESLELDLKIRTTNEGDIQEVANMLTYALLEDAGRGEIAKQQNRKLRSPLNFQFRNTRSGVAPLIQSRLNAIKIGEKIVSEYSSKGIFENLNEADQLRLLWSNDIFRNSVERAATLSNEPHIWKYHNFICAPQSFNWLFHKMITAENALTGEVIGFCEIAMLSQPSAINPSDSSSRSMGSSYFDEECSLVEEEGLPTIVNLVTSEDYRRRGVGSTIMDAAMRYLQKASISQTWNEMALYVEEDNSRAINMYERLGFRKTHLVEGKNQWYMTRQFLSPDREQILSAPKVQMFQ